MGKRNNRNKYNNSNRGKNRGSNDSSGGRGREYGNKKTPVPEKFNFQDKAMTKEYDKGWNAAIKTGASDNDASWYVPSNTLLSNVAQFPTALATGRPIPMEFIGNLSTSVRNPQITPGILVLNTVPLCATTGEPKDPINLAGSALYTAMQVNSSRNPQYNANDLMLYLLAVTSCYSFYAWCTRVYGLTMNYNIMNRYTPEPLLYASGVDPEDIKVNLANLRTFINTFAYQLASFYLPQDIDYCARQVFLYTNVYTDANTSKAQYYMYNPIGFLQWIEGEGGNLTTVKLTLPLNSDGTPGSWENLTYAQIAAYGERLLNSLRQSEDIRLMASDLIKAFGLSSSYQVAPIADNFIVSPVYNQEVLMQFENAYILPSAQSVGLVYSQTGELNNDSIKSTFKATLPNVDWNLAGVAGDKATMIQTVITSLRKTILLNFHKDDPSAEDIMVASRLSRNPINTASDLSVTGTGTDMQLTIENVSSSGTEIVLGALLYYIDADNAVQVYPLCSEMIGLTAKTAADYPAVISDFMDHVLRIAALANFDWHPKISYAIHMPNQSGNAAATTSTPYIYDLETWVTITREEWDRMNEIALYGLFECTLGQVPSLR